MLLLLLVLLFSDLAETADMDRFDHRAAVADSHMDAARMVARRLSWAHSMNYAADAVLVQLGCDYLWTNGSYGDLLVESTDCRPVPSTDDSWHCSADLQQQVRAAAIDLQVYEKCVSTIDSIYDYR